MQNWLKGVGQLSPGAANDITWLRTAQRDSLRIYSSGHF